MWAVICGVVWCGVVLLLSIPVLLITERRHHGGVNVCIRTAPTTTTTSHASFVTAGELGLAALLSAG